MDYIDHLIYKRHDDWQHFYVWAKVKFIFFLNVKNFIQKIDISQTLSKKSSWCQ